MDNEKLIRFLAWQNGVMRGLLEAALSLMRQPISQEYCEAISTAIQECLKKAPPAWCDVTEPLAKKPESA